MECLRGVRPNLEGKNLTTHMLCGGNCKSPRNALLCSGLLARCGRARAFTTSRPNYENWVYPAEFSLL